ncbi:hypothetical protein [Actinomadura latina]|uniref:Secreted protein n=1 Tax=Actinomadura latina TaxID=163603 RepID=A0A846Z1M9_9ACTN|nr:hypothetical protein [Actinomadura latina]NKZ04628.1 hypothetical protein [Actinomadura latina]
MKLLSRAALVAAPVGLALGMAAAPAQAAAPQAPVTAPDAAPLELPSDVPKFDFAKQCPPLPAGQDPKLATCLQLVVTGGSMKLGGLTQEITQPMRTVIQAVQPSWSEPAVFTSVKMTGKPMTVPGGVIGLLGFPIGGIDDLPYNKVQVQAKYAGGFDFNLPTTAINMKIKLINDAIGNGCFIGSNKDPMKLNLAIDFSTITVVTEGDINDPFSSPPILRMPTEDKTFAVPKTYGCGIFGPIIDWKAGLPSASGQNAASFQLYMATAPYAPANATMTARSVQDPVQTFRNLKIGD